MADLDLSEFDEARKRPTGCGVAGLQLTPDQRAQLEAVMARPAEYSISGIVKVIHKWGLQTGKETIRNHRDRGCACVR
jgi:hypothetical protein